MTEQTPPLLSPPASGSDFPPRWQVRLLGSVSLDDGRQQIVRLPSRAVVALLARLALWPRRDHPREELVELLWPGVALDVGRNRLRQALSSLRSLLEPAGSSRQPVLEATRLGVRAVPGALASDAQAFERLVGQRRYREARALYGGELMPGHYDDWIVDERLRLEALFDRVCEALDAGGPAAPAGPSAEQEAFVRPDPGALPRYLTRYFVDDIGLTRLGAALAQHRLVVLLGPGGSGKTRSAVEVARSLPPGGRTVFVQLAGCSDARDMVAAIAATLCLPGEGDIRQAVGQALAAMNPMLVLDNFEQLPSDADATLEQWCRTLPALRVLVTSRRSLVLDGAHELAPPAAPAPVPHSTLDALAMHPGVAMFVDRARAVRPDFHLGPGNAATVAELVAALDGLPLAIELAAARVRSLPPAALLKALHEPGGSPHLDLLARAGAGKAGRHATMRHVVDWSWRQLPAPVADFAAALSLFRTPFGPDAARAVAAPTVSATSRVARWLDELVAHSLLQAAPDIAQAGFRYAEPVRQFAAERLDGPALDAARHRLGQWLTDAAADAQPMPPALARALLPNVEVAWRDGLSNADAAGLLRWLVAWRWALFDMNVGAGLLDRLAGAWQHCDEPPLRAQAGAALAWRLFDAGRGDESRRLANESVAIALPLGGTALAEALFVRLSISWRTSRDTQGLHADLQSAMGAADRGDAHLRCQLHLLDAAIAQQHEMGRGETPARIERALARALSLARSVGSHQLINTCTYRLGIWSARQRRYVQALTHLDAAERAATSAQEWERLSAVLDTRGNVLTRLRRWAEAVEAFRGAVRRGWQVLSSQDLAYALWNLPTALARTGDAEGALQLLGFSATYWERHHDELTARERRFVRRARRLAARHFGEGAARSLWADAAQWPLQQAVQCALGAASPP